MKPLNRLFARGTVVIAAASKKMQTLQMRLLAGEVKDNLEHLEPYGFTSHPQGGAEGLVAFTGGDRSTGVVVVISDRRFRLQGLEAGEVAIYTDEGDKLHFKRNRIIDIETLTLNIKADESVNLNTPLLAVSGKVVAQGDVLAGAVSLMKHPHAGVQKGLDQSGAPLEVGE